MTGLKRQMRLLLAEKKQPILFLCGLGGSGKTAAADRIAEQSESNTIVLHCDWWLRYPTEERKKRIKSACGSGDPEKIAREENPKNWCDWIALRKDLLKLQATGHATLYDAWDQRTGLKNLKVPISFPYDGLIILEGIYLLHPEITDIADFIVLLDVPKHISRRRAEARDHHRSPSAYLAYKAALVEKYDVPYFQQYRTQADMIIWHNATKT